MMRGDSVGGVLGGVAVEGDEVLCAARRCVVAGHRAAPCTQQWVGCAGKKIF